MNQAISEYLKYIEKTFGHQPDATELLKKAFDILESDSDQKTIHDFLELGHLPIINNEIFNSKNVDEWFDIIHKLIIKSKLTVGHLINQRARYYDNKICFKVINGNNIENYKIKQNLILQQLL